MNEELEVKNGNGAKCGKSDKSVLLCAEIHMRKYGIFYMISTYFIAVLINEVHQFTELDSFVFMILSSFFYLGLVFILEAYNDMLNT